MVDLTLADLAHEAVTAFLFGFLGAIGGSLAAWLAAKHLLTQPWRELLRLIREHAAATERLAASLSDPPQPKEHA